MKNHMFFAIWAPSQASQSQNGEDVSSGIRGQEFSSRIQRIHYFPADPAEMVSGAAVQTLPNHAQESQDDVSSQANSFKLEEGPPLGEVRHWEPHFCQCGCVSILHPWTQNSTTAHHGTF